MEIYPISGTEFIPVKGPNDWEEVRQRRTRASNFSRELADSLNSSYNSNIFRTAENRASVNPAIRTHKNSLETAYDIDGQTKNSRAINSKQAMARSAAGSFVYTLTDEHLGIIKEQNQSYKKGAIYNYYTQAGANSTGTLVNLSM